MVKIKKSSIARQIEDAQQLIDGALAQPEVMKELSKLGYPPKEIQKGTAKLNRVIMLESAKSNKYGLKHSTGVQGNQDHAEAWSKYMHHVKSARLAFANDLGKQKRLELTVARKRALAEWVVQARHFYQELQQMTDDFAAVNVTGEVLAQTLAMIEAVAEAKRVRKSLAGEAQQMTQERNKALRELNTWTRRFAKMARMALEDKDQLLEGMGLLVRSKG